MARHNLTPEVRTAVLAARWAQQLGLPAGNLWEPALTRTLLADWRRLGGDGQAWTFITGMYNARLSLPHEE